MKKTILTITLILNLLLVNSQNFTLSELIKINNYSLDDFDSYVATKGYKFEKTENTDFSLRTSYAYIKNGCKSQFVSKFIRNVNNSEMVSFQTGNNDTYLKIKTELKTLGFKLYKTEEQDGALFFDYIKNKTIVTLCSGIDENEYGYKKPYYEISVNKP
jgi:hypothetical protein